MFMFDFVAVLQLCQIPFPKRKPCHLLFTCIILVLSPDWWWSLTEHRAGASETACGSLGPQSGQGSRTCPETAVHGIFLVVGLRLGCYTYFYTFLFELSFLFTK